MMALCVCSRSPQIDAANTLHSMYGTLFHAVGSANEIPRDSPNAFMPPPEPFCDSGNCLESLSTWRWNDYECVNTRNPQLPRGTFYLVPYNKYFIARLFQRHEGKTEDLCDFDVHSDAHAELEEAVYEDEDEHA